MSEEFKNNQNNEENNADNNNNQSVNYSDSYYRGTPDNSHTTDNIGNNYQNTSGNNQNNYGNDYSNFYNNPNANNQNNGYTNYYSSTPNPNDSKPPKKKHTGLKVVAVIAAVAVVAGVVGIGANQIKRVVNNISDETTEDSAETSETIESKTASSDSESSSKKGKSWIDAVSAGSALSVAEIAKKCTPSVVGVSSTFEYVGGQSQNDLYGYYFGFGQNDGSSQQQQQKLTGTGTGIVMSDNGKGGYYVMTNAHVIYDDESDYKCGEAKEVHVVIEKSGDTSSDAQEETLNAKIVGYDLDTDVAVLEIDKNDDIKPAEFGNSDDLSVGDMVVAIGNPLGFDLYNTVTCGIVSALNRNVTINEKQMTLIQTDASINSGNSGGPLINGSGQVIGMNSAKMSTSYSSNSASIEGLGFAIPINSAADIANDLINYGYVTGKPQLGMTCKNIDDSVAQAYNMPVGAYVMSVSSGSAAEKAGIQQGDVITKINDKEISTIEELNNEKNKFSAGDTVTLTLVRAGQEMKVNVTLDEKKADDQTSTEPATSAAQPETQSFFGW